MVTVTPQDLHRARERYERALAEAERARGELDETIAALVGAGYPQAQAARDLGVTRARINHIVAAQARAPMRGER